jgi:DNA-binding transcriptional LysR family regulator
MDLRQLRYLDAVARHRSFTRAARELHVAQSALSQQVRGLERELGVDLLRRTTRSVAVTEAGQLVLVRARRALAEADGIRADLDAVRGLVRGSLRIGGVPPVGCVHATVLAEFTRAHPGLALTVRDGGGLALLDQLRDGSLDLVMALVDPEGHRGLEGVRLLDEELVVVTALDHPLARARSVPVERLAGEALIGCGAESPLREMLLALAPAGRLVAEVDTLETVCELTERGLGITLLPRTAAAAPARRLALRPLRPRHAQPVSLLWRAGEQPTPAAQAFRERLVAASATERRTDQPPLA